MPYIHKHYRVCQGIIRHNTLFSLIILTFSLSVIKNHNSFCDVRSVSYLNQILNNFDMNSFRLLLA